MDAYFIGIGGSAMGQAAMLLQQQGYAVAGSDGTLYPPMSDLLADAGIRVDTGFSVEALKNANPRQVVVGNAVGRGNPQVEWLLDQRTVPFTSLPAFLHDQLLRTSQPVVVAGTHGKTTTATMLAHLLRRENPDTGWLIGGQPHDLPSGAHAGAPGAPFVIEGDEYDSAFFDKRSKFVHYAPHLFCLNNLEFDHADIFRDLSDMRRAFAYGLRLVPSGGAVLVNGDDPEIAKLLPLPWAPVVRLGEGADNDVGIRNLETDEEGTRFTLVQEGNGVDVRVAQPGAHNARNAAMALTAVARMAGHGDVTRVDPAPLATFRGVRRRLEVRHLAGPRLLIEDFAHHPTALQGTLTALRQRWPHYRLLAVFEPRSNTAVSRHFQESLVPALGLADAVLIAPVYRAERIPPDERLDVARLTHELRETGTNAAACDSFDALEAAVAAWADEAGAHPHLVAVCSNGACGQLIERLIRRWSA